MPTQIALRCAAVAWTLVASIEVSAQTTTEFPIGAGPIGGIAAGADGNVWFTETAANKIGRMTVTGEITEFPIPTARASPQRITAGPDGNLWFTEAGAGSIGRITVDGRVTEFGLPYTGFSAVAVGIAAGPDGNVWYTLTISRVGRVTANGVFQEFATGYDQLSGITAGPDGNVWFTTGADYESKICRVSPDGVIAQFGSYGELSGPREIVSAPDGNLWFIQNSGAIGRITTGGDIRQFSIGTVPLSIATWNDANLWMGTDREIISVTTSGEVLRRFPLPTGATPVIALTRGPDGNLWFVEASGTIGRLALASGRRRSAHH